MPKSVTLKELHAKTGDLVRRAGAARSPVLITDRGQPVAVLANPALLPPRRRRKRKLLPEFEALMARRPGGDLQDDLDAVRGER